MYQEKPSIAHLINPYLFQTGSWIYTQLVNLRAYRPFVMTSMLENLQQFPFDAIYSYKTPIVGKSIWRIANRKIYKMVTISREKYYISTIREQNARLLHAHFGNEGYYNINIARILNLPLITTFYGFDVSMLPKSSIVWRKNFKRLFKEGAIFLAEGSSMAQSIVDLGCPSQKIKVQHLGVDLENIVYRERIKDKNEPVIFIMAASFREKKGIYYAIQAFASANRSNKNMQLRIIGGAVTRSDYKYMAECKALVSREGLGNKIYFLGYLPYTEYLKEIVQSHIFLAPSITAQNGDTEGGVPVALIEACAYGIPVIASRHCDIPEVIQDGKNGILVYERDVNGLAEAMLDMADSSNEWSCMGKIGRKHIENEYNAYVQGIRMENIYDTII